MWLLHVLSIMILELIYGKSVVNVSWFNEPCVTHSKHISCLLKVNIEKDENIHHFPKDYKIYFQNKWYFSSLQVHSDVREMVGRGKSMECFKKAVLVLKEKCLVSIRVKWWQM
jgi:hypothetical protein